MKNKIWMFCLILISLCACATTPYCVPVSEKARAEFKGKGIPYYLPHPYLLVTKNMDFVDSSNAANNNVSYNARVVYLPDYDQKYAICLDKGLGTYNASITLVDGWNLTGINASGDSKLADTIKATAELAGNIATLVAKGQVDNGEAANSSAAQSSSGIWLYDLAIQDGKIPQEVFSKEFLNALPKESEKKHKARCR